jgi:hypothetical protein
VNSLRKLELIGDHRQLPAFVQQCWFHFESTMPSLKTSLFERLISGKVKTRGGGGGGFARADRAQALPYTILDEQRRMRTTIADITRPDYQDVVAILDHKATATQRIGDKCGDNKQVSELKVNRETWPTRGREVPGVAQSIFFWDLADNAESRPIAGLSACNQSEAEAVAGLTKWLLQCGVPPSSISIITPYKGQKVAITKV